MDVSSQDWLTLAEKAGASQTDADGVMATFYDRPVHNKAQSEKEGRPIYTTKTYVLILIPGQSKTRLDRAVKPEDKTRWPVAWDRYTKRERGISGGTPINEWPYLTATRLMELKALGYLTVEQLAQANDNLLGKLGPDGMDLRKRAQEFIQGEDETVKELRAELQEKDRELKAVRAQMADMQRGIDRGEIGGGDEDGEDGDDQDGEDETPEPRTRRQRRQAAKAA